MRDDRADRLCAAKLAQLLVHIAGVNRYKTAAFDRCATPPVRETAMNIGLGQHLQPGQGRLDADPAASTAAAPCTSVP